MHVKGQHSAEKSVVPARVHRATYCSDMTPAPSVWLVSSVPSSSYSAMSGREPILVWCRYCRVSAISARVHLGATAEWGQLTTVAMEAVKPCEKRAPSLAGIRLILSKRPSC